MRKNRIAAAQQKEISILALDDDAMMTVTVQSYFQSSGYQVDIENDPFRAVERIRTGNYDILLLDFLMTPICGDEVVAEVRKFNSDICIILLTGHKSLAPPIKTIRELDIQGYYEKSDRFDQLELLVESCVKSIHQMRMIRQYRDQLGQIVAETPEIYGMRSLPGLIDRVLEQVRKNYGMPDVFFYICRPLSEDTEKTGETFQEYFGGTGLYEGRPELARSCWDALPDSQDCWTFPLSDDQGHTVGLFGGNSFVKENAANFQLLQVYLRQVAGAVSNLFLQLQVENAKDQLQQAYVTLQESYEEMAKTVRSMVDARDLYTRGHSDRVSYYAALLAEKMGKDSEYIRRLRLAGLFHDIGKVGVSDDILLKDSSLTEEEIQAIRRHPVLGYRILSASSLYKDIAPVALYHHERVDGTGYPEGLRGEEIPEQARIVAVADAFDAMTSYRRYQKNRTLEEAVQQLIDGKDRQFDGKMVDLFVEVLKDYQKIHQALAWTYEEGTPGKNPEKWR